MPLYYLCVKTVCDFNFTFNSVCYSNQVLVLKVKEVINICLVKITEWIFLVLKCVNICKHYYRSVDNEHFPKIIIKVEIKHY